MSIWRFSDGLPEVPDEHKISLGEGSTPLIRSQTIGPQAGLPNLYFKIESGNPTGSYKDRFAAAAISRMLAERKRLCLATSSGNTGSALAAYCAAAQMECRIAIVETAPAAKLRQMLAYGAELVRVSGFGVDSEITARTMECLRESAERPDAALQISAFRYSPAGMSGVQTISYELVEQAAEGIDHVFCPAGGGGLTLAVARGFALASARRTIARSPAVHCVQPAGNDTIAGPLRRGEANAQAVGCTSQISGLQVPNVIDGDEVIAACRPTGGTGHVVTDKQVWDAQRRLAREEGIFCEPAAATALAGALQAAKTGEIRPQDAVVCLVTGSGFKDVPSIDRLVGGSGSPVIPVDELSNWIGGGSHRRVARLRVAGGKQLLTD